MWKAVLVLLMISNSQPADSDNASMMVGEFPDTFVSEADCKKFLSSSSGEIDSTVDVFTEQGEQQNYSVLSHEVNCVVDDKPGQPT